MSRPICERILISKDRFTVFTNYPSATKDQALYETVLTLFYSIVHGCFQLAGVTIETGYNRPSQRHQRLILKSKPGKFSAH